MNRVEAQANINTIVGATANVSSIELDYICGLKGDYQQLAIAQAALGHMIKIGGNEAAVHNLEAGIAKLSADIFAQEQAQYKSKSATWDYDFIYKPDKTGKIQHKKIESPPVLVKPDVQVSQYADYLTIHDLGKQMAEQAAKSIDALVEGVCLDCVDGLITSSTGAIYPCSCSLGDKHAKNKEPIWVTNHKKMKKAQEELANKKKQEEKESVFAKLKVLVQGHPKLQQTVLEMQQQQQGNGWLGNLGAIAGIGGQGLTGGNPAAAANAQGWSSADTNWGGNPYQSYTGIGGTVPIIGGTVPTVHTEPFVPSTKPEPKVENIKVPEEVKGRKFRDA